MKNIIIFFFCVVAFSCKKNQEESSTIGTQYVGSWKMSSYVCNGTPFTIKGVDEYLVLNETSARIFDYGSLCLSSGENLKVIASKDSFKLANGITACSLTSCALPATLVNQVNLAQVGVASYCSAGNSISESPAFTLNNDQLVMSNASGSVTCTSTYSRETAIPTQECLKTNNATLNANATNIVGINSDGNDKAAMQFQVASAEQLRAINILMTSESMTTIEVKLYQGGLTPDAGILLATSLKIEPFGFTSATPHIFEFSPAVSLNAGIDYYLVLRGTGTTIPFKIYLSNTNTILAGSVWTYSGTWAANTNLDFKMGFIFTDTSCP